VSAKILVTGGSGFIGSALVKALLRAGANVRVLDDNSRGHPRRLADVKNDIEFVAGDIRDAAAVASAAKGLDEVHHLAFVNGTEFFYTQPDLVLDVGLRGMLNVIDACRAHGIGKLILASSSEVYQTPPQIPTDETAPLTVPDVQNPRYSYGAGKLISEVLAVNFGRKYFERVLIFRPHNVYGPDMGNEHVIPQLALRLQALAKSKPSGRLAFQIQGTGEETRSFCFVDDLVAGVLIMRDRGEHLGVYHVGTADEISIADLVRRIAACAKRDVEIVPGSLQPGGTMRRCPDISKLAKLGYKPRVLLDRGLPLTLDWYWRQTATAEKP
jgi:nucleoside-diphosphate-sugar epimerase